MVRSQKLKMYRWFGIVLSVCLVVTFCITPAFSSGVVTRASTDSSGIEGDNESFKPSISSDGRYIAFISSATNLVSGDTNGKSDIFLRDTQTSTTIRVSTGSPGNEGNDNCGHSAISSDGRYVAFSSWASNLVTGDTNGATDVFLKDTQTGATTRVSTDSGGGEGNGISEGPSISANGRYVTFHSHASNLVSGDTNGQIDCFVKDALAGTMTIVSTDSSGGGGNNGSFKPSISPDGRFVAFQSMADNLVLGDNNRSYDVFVKDTQTGTTERVSTDSSGGEGNGRSWNASISNNGNHIAFESLASNLVSGDTNEIYDVFVKDTSTGSTTRVSTDSSGGEGDNMSSNPSISASGRYAGFDSKATNLVSEDTNGKIDVFIKDTLTDETLRLSTDSSGNEGDNNSYQPSISSCGYYISFSSLATNLVSDDTNGVSDVFLAEDFELQRDKLAFVARNSAGNQSLWLFEPPCKVGGNLSLPVASDNWIGDATGNNNVTAMASGDYDSDGESELAFVVQNISKEQNLWLFESPSTVGGDLGSPIASDYHIGDASGNDNVKALSSGDYDGDGDAELALLTQATNGDQSLSLYEAPITIGGDIGSPFASAPAIGNVSGNINIICMTSADFDSDDTSEIAFVTQNTSGVQSLWLFEPPTSVGGGLGSMLASDYWIGNASSDVNVILMSSGDFDADGTTELSFVTQNAGGDQSLWLLEAPTSVGGDIGSPFASDYWIGNASGNVNVKLMSGI